MAAVATPRKVRPLRPVFPMYRFTVDQYHKMIEAGVLTEEDKVELLDGWIVEKMPRNPLHDGTITRIDRRLRRALTDEWLTRIQSAATLQDSEPEPDLAVVPGPEEVYFLRHPVPRDILLLVEVADTSLMRDRAEKGPIYAAERIAVYWIVNLNEEQIEVYTEPRGGKNPHYRKRKDYGRGDAVPFLFPGQAPVLIPVQELLP